MGIYMNTSIHFSSYLTQFFLDWEMVQTKVVEKIETQHVMLNNFLKSCHLWDYVDKQCSVGQATHDSMVHIACWIPKATNTLEICNVAFQLQQ
jgi:hypothetical protein